MIEHEVRYLLDKEIKAHLTASLPWSETYRLIDITFGLTGPDSMQTAGWVVRVRRHNHSISIQYKAPLNDSWTSWEEISVGVLDFEASIKFLIKIGLKPGLILDRHRRDVLIGDYKLTLDEFEFIGDYLEMEYLGNSIPKYDLVIAEIGLPRLASAPPYGVIMLEAINDDAEIRSKVDSYINSILNYSR